MIPLKLLFFSSLTRLVATTSTPFQRKTYTVPQDTHALLLAAPGSEAIGQPVVTVYLVDDQAGGRQRLVFDVHSILGARYTGADLFVGCRIPEFRKVPKESSTPSAIAPRLLQVSDDGEGQTEMEKEQQGERGKRQSQPTPPQYTKYQKQQSPLSLDFNFSENCRPAHNGLGLTCEVPLAHLVYDRQSTTGCWRAADGGPADMACGQVIRTALRVDAVLERYVGAGRTTAAPLHVWAQGVCIEPRGKRTSEASPTCDATGKMEQYFDFVVDCEGGW